MYPDKNRNPELIHAHVCTACGHAARREEPDGTPDTSGILHCSKCGHEGPLNVRIIEADDPRLKS
jgi:hypothetical protein